MSNIYTSGYNSYQVHLDIFSGPIVLLYQLIQKNELDITEISLSLITDEFLLHIQEYAKDEQDHISEFVRITTHLLYLKSKSLLPFLETEEDVAISHFTDEILERLLFFSRLEKGIDFLIQRTPSFSYFKKESPYIQYIREEHTLQSTDILKLVILTEPWLKEKTQHSISKGQIKPLYMTVEEMWVCLLKEFSRYPADREFLSIIKNFTPVDKIISFLTILEKAKQQQITLKQEELFQEIFMELVNAG